MIRILCCLLILLTRTSVINAQIDGRIAENREVTYYVVKVYENIPFIIQIKRVSGDLRPIVVVTSQEGLLLAPIYPNHSSSEESTITLTYVSSISGLYNISVEGGALSGDSTIGDFFIEVDGANFVNPYLASSLPVPLNDHHAIVLMNHEGQVIGNISDSTGTGIYYLFEVNEDTKAYNILMQRESGNLLPNLVILDKEGNFVVRGYGIGENQSQISLSTLESGWYYMIAARFDFELGTTTGVYNLRFIESSNDE